MRISQIIDKIDDNQLFVPAFQREFVWKRTQAKDLFSSLLNEYPTGTLLTWETTGPPELKGSRKYSSEMGAIKLILDGQQRITTIYMLLTGKIPPYYNPEEIENDIRGLYVNLQSMELEYYKKITMENNPFWVDLTKIFKGEVRGRDIRKKLEEQGPLHREIEDLIDDHYEVIRSIKEREFPEQTIPIRAKINEAIDIFYRVNSSGINLTEAELALAQICGYWPSARKLLKEKRLKLQEEGFGFSLDFMIYAILAVTHDNGSNMKLIHGSENKDKVVAAWEVLDKYVLDYVVKMLRSHAFVGHIDEINSVFALIPVISFVYKKPNHKLSEPEIKRVIKWFYYSQLRQRYVSQSPQKLDKDLKIVKHKDKPFAELLTLIEQERKLEITPGEFEGRDIRHPLFSLMRWYFKSRKALCLGTGLELHQKMAKKYTLERDHIFPYADLQSSGYPVGNRIKYAYAQELTNRVILTECEYRNRSDSSAKDYLEKVDQNFPSALKLQSIPMDKSLWEMNRFEDFLAARRSILAKELNEFLEGITEVILGEGTVDLMDQIKDGEHGGLEFKSTLRWDAAKGSVNRELEKVVLKSIAAFNNGQGDGGRLIIGVDDEENIVGLEQDYSTLKDGGGKDAFERHIRGLIQKEWDVELSSRIIVSFEEVSGEDVCLIDVSRGVEPLYLNTRNEHGQLEQKFYVRTGNSSQPITLLSEITQYINSRFKNS
ncbi:MAG: DUF262 domain-containing protein [Gammaproteobacteria bacterium]|nr:DUF262 domain-containing protein [Gammaproteobacteria bacterium]